MPFEEWTSARRQYLNIDDLFIEDLAYIWNKDLEYIFLNNVLKDWR